MNTLLIIIDLSTLDTMLSSSIEGSIKGNPMWARISKNVWMIKTAKDAATVRNEFRSLIPSSVITVFNISGDSWATSNASQEINNWMQNNL